MCDSQQMHKIKEYPISNIWIYSMTRVMANKRGDRCPLLVGIKVCRQALPKQLLRVGVLAVWRKVLVRLPRFRTRCAPSGLL